MLLPLEVGGGKTPPRRTSAQCKLGRQGSLLFTEVTVCRLPDASQLRGHWSPKGCAVEWCLPCLRGSTMSISATGGAMEATASGCQFCTVHGGHCGMA